MPEEQTQKTIAFIGLGHLGRHFATSLFDAGVTVDRALRNLGLTQKTAGECGVPLDLASPVAQTLRHAQDSYGRDAWFPKVVKLLEDVMGVDRHADGFPAKLEPSSNA